MTTLSSKLENKSSQATSEKVDVSGKRHFKLIENTYNNNIESDYTEQIGQLTKQFDYSSNSEVLWGPPELSVFYGTPLYEQASEAQRKALNHLYWVAQYTHTANAEANTILYNKVTSGVFSHFSEYKTLCEELDFESDQELTHIAAFQKIGFKTKVALMGKESLVNPSSRNNAKRIFRTNKQVWRRQLSKSAASATDTAFRMSNQVIHWNNRGYYSQYLRKEARETIPTTTGGLAGVTASPSAFKFLTLNWGSSPFLAAQYYSARMIANMSLKAYEHVYYKRCRKLEKSNDFVPLPTKISSLHLLDEAFHTTLSSLISQELYRDFDKPTMFEKALSDLVIERLQRGLLGGLSGGMNIVFRDDSPFLDFYYRLLCSKLFNMSPADARYWMKRILCEEHDGYHTNSKYHQSLLANFKRFFSRLDYLSPVNREMLLMSQGASIEMALERNRQSFQSFFQKVLVAA